ncbi:unnamed protein product [Clonostachys rosea f. rosea IK726]|uniref:Major facilitator superfamily (MFS) profile domain-containing protein n=2 Tax=Bionectria ochroleuca TaxID=29856 RepID=A0A0B7JR74_BIOOC|nr:unnamed protein product [Clonostachys rosea f. rosea IK726]
MVIPAGDSAASPKSDTADAPGKSSSRGPEIAQERWEGIEQEGAGSEEKGVATEEEKTSGQARFDEAETEQPPQLPFSKARCIALVATLTGASFLNTLSIMSVVIILPTIGEALDIPETRLQWVVSSYSLTFGCFLLIWGRIADVYGKRLIFIGGSIWVTAIAAANAFLPNEIAFDLFRALHGLGAAANVPTAIGILGVTFPPGKAKNYAFSTYAAGAPLGSVCGNILSGLIAEYANWKWVFGATAIMAGIISAAGIFVIPPTPTPSKEDNEGKRRPTIDWIGGLLITVGLLALMVALTEGNVVGWATPWVPVLIVVSFLIIAVFVYWQNYIETRLPDRSPLLKVSLFRNTRFSAVIAIMGLFFAAFNNYLVFATYYFQSFQGLSPIQTTLRFIPTGVSGAIIAAIVSQLLHWVPTVYILTCGTIAMCGSCILFAVPIPPSTSYFAWGLPAMILAVIGADTCWPSLTLFTSHSLSQKDQAIGGALINASGQLGRSIGLAISTAVQTSIMANARQVPIEDAGAMEAWDFATLKGIRAASWMNFGLGAAAVLIVPLAFRTLEIIGKPTTPQPVKDRSDDEGVVRSAKDEEDKAVK